MHLLPEHRHSPQEEDAHEAADERPQGTQDRELLVTASHLLVNHEVGKPQEAEDQRHDLRLPEAADDVGHRDVHILRLGEIVAEDVLQLAEADDDGRTAGKAARHGVAQEGNQEAKLENATEDLHQAHGRSCEAREAHVALGAHLGLCLLGVGAQRIPLRALLLRHDFTETRLDQQRDHGHRAYGKLARLPEERVDEGRDASGVHAVDVREASNGRVGHALWDHHDPDGHACDEVRLDDLPVQLR
mmetsp:Transcript_101950/g.271288  ORF Transcript_101950/g.271288 Transcript_101950/m.271288 type:complete len:245 (-) Transcript_101950:314-1048(-)